MIAMTHHMPLACEFTMTNPHREDWLRWQGQTPGKQHLLRWDSPGDAFRRRIFGSKQVETYPLEEVNVKLFELLPFLDLPGQCSLTIAPPIDLIVKQALARLESRPSRQWLDAIGRLEAGCPVRLELSLEELALLLERVDFSSSRLEDIEAMKFWSHLEASCELLEALGHEWSNHLGFDCHESFSLVWCVPEGMVGYLAWLARCARPVPALAEELRYLNPRCKLAVVAVRLLNTLAAHVNPAI